MIKVGPSHLWDAIAMQLSMLKSKIHRAKVTAANVNYEGSLSVDSNLMEQAGLLPYERILCGNMANGNRFETYVIAGERGTGSIILNGATSHLGKPGDLLTIMSYACVEEGLAKKWQPRVIVLGPDNQIINERGV
jgi:aspartate 1-decarboxylase